MGKKKDKEKLEALREEARQELAKKGDVIVELPIDKDKLNETNFTTETKFTYNAARYANDLNTFIKK
ncbi:hypothetical protein [Streptococcus mitis]|uniref:Uncharacterized protein n=1 Tax=Streptococcus mitis SK1080 TaxID=1008453 RepID=F9HK95_STRMT|nr:hypothetical protein [Streptococcus mitis]EGP70306.1 hypothetical protein HMPREF9957_0154 [Streptococcus mitis SK1080]